MKKSKSLLAAITLSSFASLASAEVYIGGNYAFIDADDVEVGAIVLKAGYQLSDWAAVEARYGFGVDDDSIDGIDVELNHLYGGYFLAGFPNDSSFYPYAIIGYTKGEAEASGFGVTIEEDESDFSYGIGTDYNFSERVAANLEFIRYMEIDDEEFDAISLGLTYKF